MDEGRIRRCHPALTTVGFGGTQAIFALFSSQAVTHLKTLGLRPSEITVTLLSGPICGAIFQPYFGSWSDNCQSRWGRRRPFIVIGTVVAILSVLSLAWVDLITETIIPQSSGAKRHRMYRTVLVILTGFLTFTMFTAMQAVQVNLRALLTDNCTAVEQDELNAWAGIHLNFAACFANLAAFFDISKYIHRFGSTLFTDASVLSTAYMAITIATTCWCFQESALYTFSIRKEATDFRSRWRIITGLSNQIKNICLVQFLAWLGWFPFLFFVVTYVNSLKTSSMTNDSDIGSLMPLIYTIVALFFAIILNHNFSRMTSAHSSTQATALLVRPWSITSRNIWFFSHGVFAIGMFGSFWVHSAEGTILLFSIAGFSWAVACRIPYCLLNNELCRSATCQNRRREVFADSQGLIHGIFNFSICLAQIVVLLMINIVWMSSSSDNEDGFLSIVWFLRLGGVSALLAMYFTAILREPEQIEYDEIAMEEGDSEFSG